MSTATTTRLAHRWVSSGPGVKRGESAAVLAARAWGWAVQQVKRLTAQRELQTPQDVLAYARSIELTMPNQAAELRFIVMHQADLID
jgi:hypothetical protein